MDLTLEQALKKGIEAHKAGKVQEADQYYTAILKANPKHPDANHNMGVLAVDIGKVEEALPFFKNALDAKVVLGNGASQRTLQKIDMTNIDYFLALTSLDEINLAKVFVLISFPLPFLLLLFTWVYVFRIFPLSGRTA